MPSRHERMVKEMGIGENVMLAMALVILMAVAVGILQFFVPLNTYTEFHRICGAYQDLADKQGGLTVDQEQTLRQELGKIGMENPLVRVSAPGSVAYGEQVYVEVEGAVKYQRFHWLQWQSEDLPLSFVWRTENRKLVN